MKYRYEVKRRKRSDEDIAHLEEYWGNEVDEMGERIFDKNNPNHIFREPEVLMLCRVCGKEAWIEHEILIEVNYGSGEVHGTNCMFCNSDEKRMYPKNLVDGDNNPITIDYLLKNFKQK